MDKKKRLLVVDRDGTMIAEPPGDMQVDSLEKLEFLPGAISALAAIVKNGDFELVMATNQDGLGTASFPEEAFRAPHDKMLRTLAGEGVVFADQLIDTSFEHEKKPGRKPGTAMFCRYLAGDHDMARSFVVGDRLTDVVLAKNLGAKAIWLQPEGTAVPDELRETCVLVTDDWAKIAEFLRAGERTATVRRTTGETDIAVTIDLDGRGVSAIDTGLKFLDHMLWQIVHHAGVSLGVTAAGDLGVDEHHTVEDIAIVLGEAVQRALGSKRGIERYGFVLPMDESEATVLIDFGGRIDFVWDAAFGRERIGDVPTEMFPHFFKSFATAASCNLHIRATGTNEHHKIEGVFKAFARALRAAVRCDRFSYELPSSKGVI